MLYTVALAPVDKDVDRLAEMQSQLPGGTDLDRFPIIGGEGVLPVLPLYRGSLISPDAPVILEKTGWSGPIRLSATRFVSREDGWMMLEFEATSPLVKMHHDACDAVLSYLDREATQHPPSWLTEEETVSWRWCGYENAGAAYVPQMAMLCGSPRKKKGQAAAKMAVTFDRLVLCTIGLADVANQVVSEFSGH